MNQGSQVSPFDVLAAADSKSQVDHEYPLTSGFDPRTLSLIMVDHLSCGLTSGQIIIRVV